MESVIMVSVIMASVTYGKSILANETEPQIDRQIYR